MLKKCLFCEVSFTSFAMSTQTNLPEFQEMALEFLGVSFSYPTTWVTNTELLQAGVLLLAPPDVFSGPQGSPNPLGV